ncbi:MAG: PAS domain S-box protein [Verrucomicrobiota bacterium]|nr:PAS domain S-box protein [Limisphaera sp.]MDW8381625.1 PAS domain S-box protein [Verrucomicrobiota bacterium]
MRTNEGVSVLIVDDDASLRKVVAHALLPRGWKVLEAADAQSGLTVAKLELPDLVLCDVQMPGMDGFAFVTELRQHPRLQAIPVILMTGDESLLHLEGQRRAMNLGADDFLTKPFSAELLIHTIEARLHRLQQQKSCFAAHEMRWRAILDASNDAIALAEAPSLRISYMNPAARRLFGWDGQEPGRTRLSDLFLAQAAPQEFAEILSTVCRNGHWEGRVVVRDSQGHPVPMALTLLHHHSETAGTTFYAFIGHDLRDRLQIESALQDTEARFQALATAASDGIMLLEASGQILFMNPAAERILGCKATEVLGRHPDGVRRVDTNESLLAFLDRDPSPGTRQLPIERPDGQRIHVELRLSRVELGGQHRWVAIVRDITQEHALTRQLQQERILLRTLIDALPYNIYVKDRMGRKTLANKADLKALGAASEAEVLGKSDYDLLPRHVAAACFADDMRVILQGEPVLNRRELIINHLGGHQWLETTKLPLRDDQGTIVGLVGIGRDITAHLEAEQRLRMLSQAIEQSPASVVITDAQARIEYVNPRFTELTGYTLEEVRGQNPRILKSGKMDPAVYRDLWETLLRGQTWRGEFYNRKKNGELYWEQAIVAPIKDETGRITHYLAMKEDITELRRAREERDRMEIQLRQAQKLEAIGQLAAGIAHEINTPMQYVGDNTRFVQDAFRQLAPLLQQVLAWAMESGPAPAVDPRLDQLRNQAQQTDLEYLLEEVPKAMEQTLQGVERVTRIVRAMKEFSHPGTTEKTLTDLNHAIETTVTVSRNEWKYVAEMELDLDPQLPMVQCLPGELNQALLNLIVNAAHAIAERLGPQPTTKGKITIRTRRENGWVEIRITDTGCGISENIRHRIFEPFFTTKPVGRGSGQGLPIVRNVVVDKHGGSVDFESVVGQGTTFILRLPVPRQEARRS